MRLSIVSFGMFGEFFGFFGVLAVEVRVGYDGRFRGMGFRYTVGRILERLVLEEGR